MIKMTKKYYIVGNRACNTRQEAEKYCNENDFGHDLIIEAIPVKRYYELQTQPIFNKSIYHNRYYTEDQLQQAENAEYIQGLKNGEYTESLIHLKEITENEYNKIMAS